jgi:uncharacterized protein involved in oxidation of intracellular sulfur
MKTLLILNGAPYGSEHTYNGLRLAGSLAKRQGEEVRVFLMGDAAGSAKKGQAVPKGFYNVENMLGAVSHQGGSVGVCGSCMDARGIVADDLAEGAHRGSLEEVTDWTLWADKVLVF